MRRFVYYGAASAGASLLLDLYPAAAAYSLRKLRTAYTGAAIRVRRSSDNTEQDIGFSAGVLDTTALLSFVGAGNGFVTTWYDQQGSFNVTQTSSAAQPQIVSSGSVITRGSLPAVKFDGSNDFLRNLNQAVNKTNFSSFTVSNNDVLTNIGTIASFRLSFNTIRLFNERRVSGTKRMMIINNGAATNYPVEMSIFRAAADPLLLSCFVDASNNMSGFDNGNVGTTNTFLESGPLIYTPIVQLGTQSTGLTYLNGTIQEAVFYDTNESANRTAIETNINAYYGIY